MRRRALAILPSGIVVAVAVAASAQGLSGQPAPSLCALALNGTTSQWETGALLAPYVAEARRRGYTPGACRALAGRDGGQNPASGASAPPFDDTEAQLRIKQASGAAAAALHSVEELRKAVATEKAAVVKTDQERDINRETVKALEQKLQEAETTLREREAAVKAAQEARSRGLAGGGAPR